MTGTMDPGFSRQLIFQIQNESTSTLNDRASLKVMAGPAIVSTTHDPFSQCISYYAVFEDKLSMINARIVDALPRSHRPTNLSCFF